MADVAQLVEPLVVVQVVAGSSPVVRPIFSGLSMPKAAADFIPNDPAIGWGAKLQPKSTDSHKYDHGHVVILGSRRYTGAGCLAAVAALRMGAGLVTVVSPSETAPVYRMASPSLIVELCEETARFKEHLKDERRNVALIGPGAGLDNPGGLRKAVFDAIQMQKICILDADALTVFENDPQSLWRTTNEMCVLTPHEGEFARLFPDLADGSKVERAQAAALRSRAIIVLKGHETVIASPQGGCVVNSNGTGWLATAGAGDVLAGMIAGLAARNLADLSLFGTVCAAVWMHGEAATNFGPALISEDIAGELPAIWADLLSRKYVTKAAKPAAAKPAKKKKAA